MRQTHLQQLESESIHIIREVVAEFDNPVMLYSVGKDSSVMVHLARKAFFPAKIPFPLMHIDTTMKFKEMYAFRDQFISSIDAKLIIHTNQEAVDKGANPFDLGTQKCCGLLKTKALLDGIKAHSFDAAFGGARRDEEKSRAKERIFSFRDSYGQWDPKNQRPELWHLYNTKHNPGETFRVFPLSNWTELDIWMYIQQEKISVVPMYFAMPREMIVRRGQLIPVTGSTAPLPGETKEHIMCRFRTLGCYPCTGAIRSEADTIEKIISELKTTRYSERITRIIDHDADSSMETKKREGYF